MFPAGLLVQFADLRERISWLQSHIRAVDVRPTKSLELLADPALMSPPLSMTAIVYNE
jgi:hypothetical protein